MRRLGKKLLAGPYLMWMLLFTEVPLILLVYNVTSGDRDMPGAVLSAGTDPA